MSTPTLMPTKVHAETFGGFTYHIDGELVPVLTVELNGQQNIYFEHHIMLWKNTTIEISLKKMKGAFKRVFAGLPVFMTQADGSGNIAFSRDGAGHIFPIHLQAGQEIETREHQFLASTDNIEYGVRRVQGFGNLFAGGSGFFLDHFHAQGNDGILWLHGYGNVFEVNLEPGEQIDIEPGGWLFKDPAVQMDTIVQKFTTGLFGSGGSFIANRFTGPGRIGIQSMSPILPNTPGK